MLSNLTRMMRHNTSIYLCHVYKTKDNLCKAFAVIQWILIWLIPHHCMPISYSSVTFALQISTKTSQEIMALWEHYFLLNLELFTQWITFSSNPRNLIIFKANSEEYTQHQLKILCHNLISENLQITTNSAPILSKCMRWNLHKSACWPQFLSTL